MADGCLLIMRNDCARDGAWVHDMLVWIPSLHGIAWWMAFGGRDAGGFLRYTTIPSTMVCDTTEKHRYEKAS